MSATDDTTGGGGTTPNDDNNFGRARTPGYQDNDAGMAEMLAANARTPDEKHQADEDAMRRFLSSDDAKLVTGRADATPLVVESPEVFRELQKADPNTDASQAVAEAADRATKSVQDEQAALAAAEAARAAAPQAAGADAGGNAGKGTGPDRPMELERQLASINMSKDRELRMVIQGDESVRIKFYAKLEEMGKLRYQGGTPVINMSMKDMRKTLEGIAQKEGFVFQPVARLEYNRAGSDWTKDLVGAAKDMIGRKHQVDIFVVGDRATVDKKVDEITTVLHKMSKDGLLAESNEKHFKDGKLNLGDERGVTLQGSQKLSDMVGQARSIVDAHRRHEQEQEQARKDFRNKEVDDKMAKVADKLGGAAEAGSAAGGSPSSAAAAGYGASSAPQTPVSPYVMKLKDGMADGFSEMGKLSVQPEGKKQITAEILLNQARTFNAKDVGELNKLSTAERQTLVTQLALTTAMADTGTFGKKLTSDTIDKAYEADPAHNRAASPSIRAKVGELVAAERLDPQFEARAVAVLNELESKGVITRDHATKAFETLAPGKELPEPAKAAEQAAPVAEPKAEVTTETAGAAKQQDLFRDQAETGSVKAPTQDAVVVPAELRTLGVSQADFADALPRIQESLKAVAPDVAEALKNAADNIPRASSREDEVDIWKQGQAALAKLSPEAVSKLEEAIRAQLPQASAPVASAAAGADVSVSKAAAAPEQGSTPAVAEPVKAAQADVAQAAPAAPAQQATAVESAGVEMPAASAVKTSALVEKIDALVRSGPQALTREDASSLLASLEGRQATKLAALDGRGGNLPTQTLERIDGILKEVASGRHGDDLAASAKNLGDALDKWKGQDAQRLSKDHGLTPDALDSLRGSLRKEDGAWHGAGKEASAASEGKSVGNSQGGTTVDAPKATAQAATGAEVSASEAAKAIAAERYNQTELAAGKLAVMMANPAGAFTNKDKSWNERNVEVAAQAVMRVDVDAVRTMSANQRNQIAAYAAWMADNANSGRLPGFTGADGQARAQELTSRATALVGVASGKMPAGVSAQLVKADRMVGALQQRAMAAPRRASNAMGTGAASNSRSASGAAPQQSAATAAVVVDGTRLARDLGHAVFKEKELSAPYAKYLLKNAGALTSDALKSLSPTEKAQAAVGLAHLAQEVRGGAMGDFKDLSPTLQRQVTAAQQVANKLHTELSGNSTTQVAMTKAYMDLQSGGAAEKPQQAGPKAPEQAQQKAPAPSADRGMER